jgi:hypothetical protein
MARNIQAQMDEWLASNRRDLVQCDRQPGNLLITKNSCNKRQLRAREENLDDIMTGDVMDYMYRKGLAICLDCNRPRARG